MILLSAVLISLDFPPPQPPTRPASSSSSAMPLPRERCVALLLTRRRSLTLPQLTQIHLHLVVHALHAHLPLLLASYFSLLHAHHLARLLYAHAPSPPALPLWNAMVRSSPPREGLRAFASQTLLPPDSATLTSALGACARMRGLREGMQLHCRVLKSGFLTEVMVATTGLHFYAVCGDVRSARNLFHEMPIRTVVSWNALMNGYCWKGEGEVVVGLFRKMLEGGHVKPTEVTLLAVLSACSQLGMLPTAACVHGFVQKSVVDWMDVFIGTEVVNMYSKCGCLSSAVRMFEAMVGVRNVLTWTAMVGGLAMHGLGKEALELLEEMETDNIRPNEATFTCLLWACCHAGLVTEGLSLFESMVRRFGVRPRIQHYGCVVDLLARAGRLEEAHRFLLDMPMEPDLLMWRSLMAACTLNGNVELGEKVGKHLLELGRRGQANSAMEAPSCEDYVALSNVYAVGQRWGDVVDLRERMGAIGVQNNPGQSSIHINYDPN